MKKLFFCATFCAFILLFSCDGRDDPYLIESNRVGQIHKDVQINDLEVLFPEDSVVRNRMSTQSVGDGSEIEIFSKEGKLLLVIQPTQEFDTISSISNIQIMDPRYKTKKGVNIESTFGDLVENYSISRIENTLSSAVVFIDDLNAYVSIDKKNLPSELRFDTDKKIEASQIPDDAKFKFFMISWN